MFRNGFAKTSKIYKSLGQFDYGLLNCTADRIQQHIIKKNHYKCVYIGEVEEGTDIPNGVGIEVLNNGDTHYFNYKVFKRDIGRMESLCLI